MPAYAEHRETCDIVPAQRASPLLFAIAVGLIVMNIFAPQVLAGPIGRSLDLGPSATSLTATATLLGYALGLFLLVPLADLVENRLLVTGMLGLSALLSGITAITSGSTLLLTSLFALGAACSAIQVLVPIAAALVPPERRGRMIGDVMSGLMAGILLSRPLASLVAGAWGWRAFYGLSTASLVALTLLLAVRLPPRRPIARERYPELIASLARLLRDEPVLRQRALTAALVMAAFSLFWTAVGVRLAEPPFLLGSHGVAAFALAGAGGALATPMFGRIGDRGLTRAGLIGADLLLIAALALAGWAGTGPQAAPGLSIAVLGFGAFLLDVGVTGDQTLGRRAINLLAPEARGRINGVFVGIFFLGGSLGSALAGPAAAWGGWTAVTGLAAAFGFAALTVNSRCREG